MKKLELLRIGFPIRNTQQDLLNLRVTESHEHLQIIETEWICKLIIPLSELLWLNCPTKHNYKDWL